jgi:hypothetical protein
MAMKKVYFFNVFDIKKGDYVVAERMATREFIKMARGQIIEDTAKEVDESLLTPEGQLKISQQRLRP